MREVCGTVVFEVAALIVDALQEQVVDIRHVVEQAGEIAHRSCTGRSIRISVLIQVSRQKSGVI